METSRQGVGPRLLPAKGYNGSHGSAPRAHSHEGVTRTGDRWPGGRSCLRPCRRCGCGYQQQLGQGIRQGPAVQSVESTERMDELGWDMDRYQRRWQRIQHADDDPISDYSTCLGKPPELSVDATEASSPTFYSKDQNTSVYDVADVYANTSEAKADFPPLNNPKFANCFLQVQSSSIMSLEQSEWPTGATFGTPIASISHQPKYGNQSGLIDVEVPVNLPSGEGTSNDFFVALVIRQGRSTAELIIDQGDTTPSAALTESLAKTVTAKMKAHSPGNTVIAT